MFLIFLSLYLPFSNKAFHIDDPGFLHLSRMIGWNPLHAIPLDFHYEGIVLPNHLPYEMPHPLLVPYFIKIVTALVGENEIALHVAFIIFPLIALLSSMKLNEILFPDSRRASLLVALFFCSMPAFLVNAQNIMADVPTVAFILLAMAGFFASFENGSGTSAYLGGSALTMAIFCSYQALAFVPLIFLYALWRRKLTLHVAFGLAIPLAVLLAWLLAVYAMYDVFPVFKSKLPGSAVDVGGRIKQGLVSMILLKKTFSILAFVGAAMIWVVALHCVLKKSLGRFVLLFLSLLPISYLATFRVTGYPVSVNIHFSAFVALGLVTLVTLAWSVWRRIQRGGGAKREIFLFVWVLCVIGYAIALLPFGAARYLLPLFPPSLMLLINDPAWSFATRARRIGLACALCGALLFAVASAFSDYEYAGTYRNFADTVKAFRANAGNSLDVWYIGEWGMHYYMDKAGARYLHADSTEPVPGDLVVLPEMPRFWAPSTQVQARMALLTQAGYSSWLPLRLFNGGSHAGFYCHAWGMLPFTFSSEPDEIFYVFKIVGGVSP